MFPRRIGRFEVLCEVRRDEIGIYFKAQDPALRRLATLKTLHPSVAGELTMRQRFVREARALSVAQHPNVLELREVSEIEGEGAFLVMEWIDGRTLAERIDVRPWPVIMAVQLVERVAQGVRSIHKQGLVHRDINPAVILMTADNRPKIMSAFWARAADDTSVTRVSSGVIVGTPGYMPPEQATGAPVPVAPTADVYSLGAILYELLMGHTPMEKAGNRRHALPELPTALEAIAATCMEQDPRLRFPDAGALADALRSVLKS
jgi:serine/threonine protein kinase